MYILGVSCYYHDAAAALLEDGILIAAAEEERFSRKKHDYGFPERAINFCLQEGRIERNQLDYVVFYEKPIVKFERILTSTLASFPLSWKVFRESMITWFKDKLWIKSQLMNKLNVPAQKVLFVDHHIAHAASAFFCSPFKEAAVMTVDGVGEWTTATMGTARAKWNGTGVNDIVLNKELRFPHSLGLLYAAFTAFLGFEVNEGEYKVMGMSPYGRPRYLEKVYQLVKVAEDGSFWLNMDYFSYHYSTSEAFSDKFIRLFGEPRKPESEFVTPAAHSGVTGSEPHVKQCQYYADVAASIQKATEEILLKMANQLYKETGMKALCMAGGVALNSVANWRILQETPFEDIYIHPAPGDSGGAIGAAMYVWHVLLDKPRAFVLEHVYFGKGYSRGEIQTFLEGEGISYESYDTDERLFDMLVQELLSGKVIGWFQGRFEWGPRALGNRSILADPRKETMKDIVNTKIKFREPFRPFAPAIIEEQAGNYFEGLPDPARHYPARFMLLVGPWKGSAATKVPAVNHMGTGRLQTVRSQMNPRYYDLIKTFGQATGVPVLLNTSFNLRGEPIVASPEDAWKTFFRSGLDVLVMENFVVGKE